MDLALRIVHLLAAIVWTGGTIALVFVAVPPVQRLQGPERAALLRELGLRWRPIGWSALGIAAVTGVILAQRAHAFHGAPNDFDWVLGVKAGRTSTTTCSVPASRDRCARESPSRCARCSSASGARTSC